MLPTRSSLLERCRSPEDEKSWNEFVNLYTPPLHDWARRAGVRDSGDFVQDVFLVCLKELPDFEYDRSRSFRAWLKTILLNNLRKHFSKPAPGILEADVPVADPAIEIEHKEFCGRVFARALELIKKDFAENTWRSFWECVVNGRPAAEVAAELEITVGAIWVNVSRVRARLKAEFGELLD